MKIKLCQVMPVCDLYGKIHVVNGQTRCQFLVVHQTFGYMYIHYEGTFRLKIFLSVKRQNFIILAATCILIVPG